MRCFIFGLLIVVAASPGSRAADNEEKLNDARAAYAKRDYANSAKLAADIAKAEPKNTAALQLLGMSQLNMREYAKAVAAFTAALELDPKLPVRDSRGDAFLKLGQFRKAIVDYDAVIEANPKIAPEHWRRGIALYYEGRYEDGVKQFETHKTVNPEDVENAAWHYLCNVHVVGKEKAQNALIAVTADKRVPMAEIQKLYAGKLKPEAVLEVAEAVKANTLPGVSARFYANLYVALWYEAEGDAKKVREHLTAAVDKYEISDYMWGVAHMHLKKLKAMDKK